MRHPIVVAITGASGAVYAVRLLEMLIKFGHEIHLTISDSGRAVCLQELGVNLDLAAFRLETLLPYLAEQPSSKSLVRYFDYRNFMAPMASGSFRTAGMVICPCSGTTLHAVAWGASNNLIQRAADVHLKEHRKLILVPRETPVALTHIENMRRACEAGAVILPASPGWYHGVHQVQDLVDFVVSRILDQLQIDHSLMKRWGE